MMNRRKFLTMLGIGTAAVAAAPVAWLQKKAPVSEKKATTFDYGSGGPRGFTSGSGVYTFPPGYKRFYVRMVGGGGAGSGPGGQGRIIVHEFMK
jgi:hypothetical protein